MKNAIRISNPLETNIKYLYHKNKSEIMFTCAKSNNNIIKKTSNSENKPSNKLAFSHNNLLNYSTNKQLFTSNSNNYSVTSTNFKYKKDENRSKSSENKIIRQAISVKKESKNKKFDISFLQSETKKEPTLFNNFLSNIKIQNIEKKKIKNSKNNISPYQNIIRKPYKSTSKNKSLLLSNNKPKLNQSNPPVNSNLNNISNPSINIVYNIPENSNKHTRNKSSSIQQMKNIIKTYSFCPTNNEPFKIYTENSLYRPQTKNKINSHNVSSNLKNDSKNNITNYTNSNSNLLSNKNNDKYKTLILSEVKSSLSNNSNIEKNIINVNLNSDHSSNTTIFYPKNNSSSINDSIITTDSKLYLNMYKKLNEIESNINNQLKLGNSAHKNNNCNSSSIKSSKSRKYNLFKNSIDSLTNCVLTEISKLSNSNSKSKHFNFLNNYTKLISNIFQKIHEVFVEFSSENRHLRDQINNFHYSYNEIMRKLEISNTEIKKMQKEIEKLKKINLNLNIKNCNNEFEVEKINKKFNSRSMEKIIKYKYNEKIMVINKNNIKDLDALYFFDKIDMGIDKSLSVPKIVPQLRFDFGEDGSGKKINKQVKRKSGNDVGKVKKKSDEENYIINFNTISVKKEDY